MKHVRVVAVLVAAWLALLLVLGFVLAGRAADKVMDRMSESLGAPAKLGDRSLDLVRGRFAFEELSVVREGGLGKLVLNVGKVDCDLAPLGLALVDRSCGELAVRDVQLELSTAALFEVQRPKHAPFRADRVVVANADLVFLPTALAPSLGKVHVHIDHAVAGPTTFKTPLSWLFALEELRATIELPDTSLRITYANGKLVAAGDLLGEKPVELSITPPKPERTDDGRAEVARLGAFGSDLAKQLVAQKAQDWLRDMLVSP